ncbi:TPA: AAA family ATPase [Escherichia coli]
MINQIDISNFGSFSDFSWRGSIRDAGNTVQNFKRLNILYGRNYSGKTTLSRIFRTLETRHIPPNYTAPSFTVYGDKGNVTTADISNHDYNVRVYNRDFVNDNLSFLVNQDSGEIKTFAIVGEKNKEIEDAIALIKAELGSLEAKSGYRFKQEEKNKEYSQAKTDHQTASDALEGKLRSHANNKIKNNREYGKSVYNISSIKQDILSTQKISFKSLSTEEQIDKLALLRQEALPDITTSINIELKITEIKKTAEELLSRSITPTQPIQELLNDSILQLWVKQGVPLHKGKRETCAFCRQNLPHDIWQVLDSHFSKESTALELAIDDCLKSVKDAIAEIPTFIPLKENMFYPEEQTVFEQHKKNLSDELDIYREDLEALGASLKTRKNNLFQTFEIPNTSYTIEKIQQYARDINKLVDKNNTRTKTLEKDKNAARDALRLTDVATFIQTISYDAELARIENLKIETNKASAALLDAKNQVTERETKITQLQGEQKDERKGAEKVNSLLSHFFGHDSIQLEAKDDADKTSVKFEVVRGGKSAFNLSEGECSLIAFCYFIAKLEEPESKGKELVIYIDDPISSLDGNHIFFMFSLIEGLIAKPIKNADGTNGYRYKQLFISTHNLDFLKYLKRLSIPRKKVPAGEGKTKSVEDRENFMLERNGGASNIMLMPAYLKDYITEFNYLFHQIYKCRNQGIASENYEPFYGFGNNLRKFLEAFLYFKYPCHDDKNDSFERIKNFFGEEDATAIALINRLNNEYSHLESIPDRGFKPLEVPEISSVANFVLDKMYESDPAQYNSLLKSIGEQPRV